MPELAGGEQWFAGDEVRGGGASSVNGSGCFRLQKKRGRKGKLSGVLGGSRSRQRRSGGGLYLANSGEPKRRSSSLISSSDSSGEELGVQGEVLVVQRASGEESRAQAGP